MPILPSGRYGKRSKSVRYAEAAFSMYDADSAGRILMPSKEPEPFKNKIHVWRRIFRVRVFIGQKRKQQQFLNNIFKPNIFQDNDDYENNFQDNDDDGRLRSRRCNIRIMRKI